MPITANVSSNLVQHNSLSDKVCQWQKSLATGWWFSPGTLVSSTNKTDLHDITELILLKVAGINHHNSPPQINSEDSYCICTSLSFQCKWLPTAHIFFADFMYSSHRHRWNKVWPVLIVILICNQFPFYNFKFDLIKDFFLIYTQGQGQKM